MPYRYTRTNTVKYYFPKLAKERLINVKLLCEQFFSDPFWHPVHRTLHKDLYPSKYRAKIQKRYFSVCHFIKGFLNFVYSFFFFWQNHKHFLIHWERQWLVSYFQHSGFSYFSEANLPSCRFYWCSSLQLLQRNRNFAFGSFTHLQCLEFTIYTF